ncbi:type VI secretion system baseplate subunit TssK [Pollutimonas harenae]|uniref:Type VI secretion system baseplate subunit TssK n=1 Tax=Pollutimonas harenae TaxID=657015 RepID=A0A853GQ19_9BURK|nr:type VI secretion system baseplate subunit TssK [Pollutimonas harenae]NYT85138.1 type VI secretion system baseplate subunit TssK [Pollutimonas harenae]TEA72480.1 type VI secretion system baseplate subunit TssK [Pollutimonas harenae]
MNTQLKPAIFWHQGLFLEPQHFQHQDAKLERALERHLELTTPWAWGFCSLQLDESALQARSLSISHVAVRWNDGAFTEFPGNARVESRRFELTDFAQGPRKAYLGLRRLMEDEVNVLRYEHIEDVTQSRSRFAALADPQQVPDLYSDGAAGHVAVMDYVLRIFWEDEIEHLGDYQLLPLVSLEQSGETVHPMPAFTPPCMTLAAAPQLQRLLQELRDEIIGRARQLEVFKKPLTSREQEGDTQLTSMLALSVLNRYGSQLNHLIEGPQAHPWTVYGVLRQLVGELSTFTEYCDLLGETRDSHSLLQPYEHADLGPVFDSIRTLLFRLLNEITLGPEMFVRFERDGAADTLYRAELPASFFGTRYRYYLMVRSALEVSETSSLLMLEGKLAPMESMEVTVNRSLPGIELIPLQTLPLGMPRRSGAAYFRVESQSELWDAVAADGRLALFLPNPPEELRVELIVIKG